jgi:CBS domain-containing protein
MSFCSTSSDAPVVVTTSDADSEEWIKAWKEVNARDLIDSPDIFSVDAETSVEDACDALLSEDILCLAVKTQSSDSYIGLFDFSDVNAFLTFAATRHTLLPEERREKPRVDEIIAAAKAGRVPVHLVSNLSEKNPLETLPHDASILSLLAVFSRGTHRVLIQSAPPSAGYLGVVCDRQLLSWFYSYAERTPSFMQLLSNPLYSLSLPSLNIYSAVVASTSRSTVLDAMKLMSEEGVSSVAVVDEETGTLLSAVSVTDIGKIVVPSQSNQILSTPLHQFISQIKVREH